MLTVVVLVGILLLLVPTPDEEVADDSVLVLDPRGAIVEELGISNPLDNLILGSGSFSQASLHDLIRSIEHAASDSRIIAMEIRADDLTSADQTQLIRIGEALKEFGESGKPIYASSSYYSQGKYFLVSHADQINMFPMGEVVLPGYGVFSMYYKNALDRVGIKMHVFRVGKYKSAVEPFLSTEMSPETKEAYRPVINLLWESYIERVGENREVDASLLQDYAQSYVDLLTESDGDAGQTAVHAGLVDTLLSEDDHENLVNDELELNGDSSNTRISYRDYLRQIGDQSPTSENRVAVLIASGTILAGDQPAGSIGSTNMKRKIEQIVEDRRVKAVVLRIDSGGGSASASEEIRLKLKSFADNDTPLVVSMAGVAASGAYWIAADANEIWAEPTTITGSIGVFGLVPDVHPVMSDIGVGYDGIGTTPLSGSMDLLSPMDDNVSAIFQSGVEQAYRKFIAVVAEGRDLSHEAVHEIAQGRVWTGKDAQQIGLVDRIGGLEEAVAAAANLAGLEDYDRYFVEGSRDPQEEILRRILDMVGLEPFTELPAIVDSAKGVFSYLHSFNDPRHVYALCEYCRFVSSY